MAGPEKIFTSDDLVNIHAILLHQFGGQPMMEKSNDQLKEELALTKNQLEQITTTEDGPRQEISNLKNLFYDARSNEVSNSNTLGWL